MVGVSLSQRVVPTSRRVADLSHDSGEQIVDVEVLVLTPSESIQVVHVYLLTLPYDGQRKQKGAIRKKV